MHPHLELGNLFGHVAAMMHRQADQMLQERLGIGMSQYAVLTKLEKQSQITQRMLADSLGQTEASISRQVSLLTQKGLVVSQIDPTERRQRLATLTNKGAKITVAASEVLSRFYEQFFAALGEKKQAQQEIFLDLLHEQSCVPGKRLSCNHSERDRVSE